MRAWSSVNRRELALARPGGRWWIVAGQELRVLGRSRLFKALILFAYIQPFIRAGQMVLLKILRDNPESIIAQLDGMVNIGKFGGPMLLEFIQFQGAPLGLLLLFAGAGAVSNDVRNNLVEVYFSKPLHWTDYVAGKVVALSIVGHLVVAVPALFLVALHVALQPGATELAVLMRWSAGILVMSFLNVTATICVVLGLSSWIKSQGLTAIAVVCLWAVTSSIGGLLASITRDANYLVISFPMALNRIAEELFIGKARLYEMPWVWPLLYCGVVMVGFGMLLARRARGMEHSN